MSNYLIFNHHSLPYETVPDADYATPEFLRVCLRASSNQYLPLLLDISVDTTWFGVCLAPGYYWRDWYRKHHNAPAWRDEVRAFRSLQTKAPLLSEDDFEVGADLVEVVFCNDGVSYLPLKTAVWHDRPVCGFPNRNPWDEDLLRVAVSRLNTNGDLVESSLDVMNLHSMAAFTRLGPALERLTRTLAAQGKDVLTVWPSSYPLLEPCGSAKGQLANWSHGVSILGQVQDALRAFQKVAQFWVGGGDKMFSAGLAHNHGLSNQLSPESSSVGQSPKLRSYREFHLPDGRKQYFEWHVKLSSGFRMHIFPDLPACKIYVGYIGPHLPLE